MEHGRSTRPPKKRDFGSITGRDIPNLTAEDNEQQAMLQYHQKTSFAGPTAPML